MKFKDSRERVMIQNRSNSHRLVQKNILLRVVLALSLLFATFCCIFYFVVGYQRAAGAYGVIAAVQRDGTSLAYYAAA